MRIVLLILTAIILSTICSQDLRTRSVSWIMFPLLAATGAFLSIQQIGLISIPAAFAGINITFLALQFGLLKLYFLTKKHPSRRIIDHRLGWGDILFLLAASFFFSPLNFICFYLLSLLFSIAFFLIFIAWKKNGPTTPSVPLAGLQALFMLLFITITHCINFPITSDSWIANQSHF